MVLTPGRKGMTTPRDGRIFEALFFCRYLSTKQLADLFFGGKANQARTRLYKLQNKGYLDRRNMLIRAPASFEDRGALQTVWYLKKEAFDIVAATHDYDETYTAKQLLDERARHYVLTNEVYVAAAPRLDEWLDPYPGWEWRHEKRVAYAGEYEDVPYLHKPDAHVVFRGHTFIVERQTAESKIGPKKVYKKVADHKRYVELRLKAPAEVLFACDNEAVAAEAERAGKQYGIRVIGGDVAHVADYLYNNAVRLS
jgi:hypothetical protein